MELRELRQKRGWKQGKNIEVGKLQKIYGIHRYLQNQKPWKINEKLDQNLKKYVFNKKCPYMWGRILIQERSG